MKKIFATIITFLMVFLTACGSSTTASVEPTPSPTPAPTEPPNEYAVVDNFILKYNTVANFPISDITEMDIHGEDYRTEFRLGAYDNALGKKGIADNSTFEVVNYGGWNNDYLRVYIHTDTLENAHYIYLTIANIFDSSITEEEFHSALYSDGTKNGIYLSNGHLGGYILGSKGDYKLLVDWNDDVDFLK